MGPAGYWTTTLPRIGTTTTEAEFHPSLKEAHQHLTSAKVELQFQWEEPELQEIGDEAVTIAAQPTPTSSTYNSDIYQGGGTYGRGYVGDNTWDNDDIYGNESKAYDTGNYYSRD